MGKWNLDIFYKNVDCGQTVWSKSLIFLPASLWLFGLVTPKFLSKSVDIYYHLWLFENLCKMCVCHSYYEVVFPVYLILNQLTVDSNPKTLLTEWNILGHPLHRVLDRHQHFWRDLWRTHQKRKIEREKREKVDDRTWNDSTSNSAYRHRIRGLQQRSLGHCTSHFRSGELDRQRRERQCESILLLVCLPACLPVSLCLIFTKLKDAKKTKKKKQSQVGSRWSYMIAFDFIWTENTLCRCLRHVVIINFVLT